MRSPWYDGSRFARDGIVCVTINYRVGADGFLYLGDGNANLGLLDQIAALEWVRENIAAFGGDPGNVTIFGESAGAMSVGTLLSMPRAEGLFRRAIAQSGAAHQVISAATAQRVGQCLAEKLGVEATREAIAAVPVDRLLAAQAELRADLVAHPDPERWGAEVVASMLPWQPVVDGDVIPARPIDRIVAGAGADIDVMVGTNTDEHRGCSWCPVARSTRSPTRRWPELWRPTDSRSKRHWPPIARHIRAPAPATCSRPSRPTGIGASPPSAWPTHTRRAASATYMYEFAWRSPQFNGRLGACHALEIPFVFDTLGNGTEPLLGADPPQQLADTMHAAWVAFATNGDCGWPKYDLSRRATMRFDTTSEVVDDPRSAERALWEGMR